MPLGKVFPKDCAGAWRRPCLPALQKIASYPASSTLLPPPRPSAVSASELSSEIFCFLVLLSSSKGKENSMPGAEHGEQ